MHSMYECAMKDKQSINVFKESIENFESDILLAFFSNMTSDLSICYSFFTIFMMWNLFLSTDCLISENMTSSGANWNLVSHLWLFFTSPISKLSHAVNWNLFFTRVHGACCVYLSKCQYTRFYVVFTCIMY